MLNASWTLCPVGEECSFITLRKLGKNYYSLWEEVITLAENVLLNFLEDIITLWEDIITFVVDYYNFLYYYTCGSNIPIFLWVLSFVIGYKINRQSTLVWVDHWTH